MSGPSPGKPGRTRGSLRSQLSGGLAAAAAGSTSLDPALRAALSLHPTPSGGITFAARAALDPLNPEASLELFRQLRRRQQQSAPSSATASPAKPAERPQVPAYQSNQTTVPFSSDSARHSEAEGGTPTSQRSLLVSADEGWGAPPPPAQLLPAQQQPQQQQAAGGLGSEESPFATDAMPMGRQESGQEAGPSLPVLSSEMLAMHSDRTASAGPHQPSPSPGGADTPRSAVSWTSVLSGALALPQTEAELQALDLPDLERLAAEAAEMQARAGIALRLAHQRLRQDGSDRGMGDSSDDVDSGSAAVGPGAQPTAVADTPSTPPRLLHLSVLLTAAVEMLLFALAGLVQRMTYGIVRPPRSLVLAPVAALRVALLALLFIADCAAFVPALKLGHG